MLTSVHLGVVFSCVRGQQVIRQTWCFISVFWEEGEFYLGLDETHFETDAHASGRFSCSVMQPFPLLVVAFKEMRSKMCRRKIGKVVKN